MKGRNSSFCLVGRDGPSSAGDILPDDVVVNKNHAFMSEHLDNKKKKLCLSIFLKK